MSTPNGNVKAIRFSKRLMTIIFEDGRKVSNPLKWYPRLFNGTDKQRAKWEIIGHNRGIHWPALDEDLSIEGILLGRPSFEYVKSQRPITKRVKNQPSETRI